MSVATMAFAVLGFLSPANRGALMTALLLLFVLMGVMAGFVSARLYKAMAGADWRMTTLKTAIMFPGEPEGVRTRTQEPDTGAKDHGPAETRLGGMGQQETKTKSEGEWAGRIGPVIWRVVIFLPPCWIASTKRRHLPAHSNSTTTTLPP